MSSRPLPCILPAHLLDQNFSPRNKPPNPMIVVSGTEESDDEKETTAKPTVDFDLSEPQKITRTRFIRQELNSDLQVNVSLRKSKNFKSPLSPRGQHPNDFFSNQREYEPPIARYSPN